MSLKRGFGGDEDSLTPFLRVIVNAQFGISKVNPAAFDAAFVWFVGRA